MTNGEGTTRRLVRRTDDRVIAGVCSGLADHFGLDPLVVRIAFVVLAGGGGVFAYLLAWALMPPSEMPAVSRRQSSSGTTLLVIAAAFLVLTGGGFLMSFIFPLGPFDGGEMGPWIVATALVVTGILVLRGRENEPSAAAAPSSAEATTPGSPLTVPARESRFASVRRPRERSGLLPLTLAAALLVAGAAALLSDAEVLELDVGHLSAVSLLVVGLGLVVGAWFGRARLLILVGLLMIPVVLVTSLVNFPPSGALGSDYLMPRRAGDLEDLRVLAGQMTLDLTEYAFEEGTESVRLRVGAGSMTVYVPKDVHVEVDAFVRGGEAYILGASQRGFEVSVEDSAGPAKATRRLKLEMVAGFGTLGVYRTGSLSHNHPDRVERRKRWERQERRTQEGPRRGDRRNGRDR